jgi:Fe-S cluster assembly protein SufD
MTELEQAKERYRADFERFERETSGNGESWTYPLRKAAIAHFAEVGFPTARDEDWKYTSVAPIAKIRFGRVPTPSDGVPLSAFKPFDSEELAKNRLVFVNGYFSERLSSLHSIPEGARVGSLSTALIDLPGAVEPYLARHASYQHHAFVALNTAFMEDGAFVYIPKRRIIKDPIHLLFFSTSGERPSVSYPRNVIVVDGDSEVKIIESYIGVGNEVYLTNGVTEVVAGENAIVDHCRLVRESEKAFHVATLQVHLDRNSNFASRSITLAGALVRNDVNVLLDGEGIECTLDGLYLGQGEQHIDNHTKIEHLKPHGTSRELYKGILDGRARAVFNGKIVVHKDAQKTDAKQTNKNLLLSEAASVDTKPQLEIFNNDVKCSHGSTIGRLEEDAIFYLRSRGIDLNGARALLTYAFATEVIQRIKIESIRTSLDDFVTKGLKESLLSKEIL